MKKGEHDHFFCFFEKCYRYAIFKALKDGVTIALKTLVKITVHFLVPGYYLSVLVFRAIILLFVIQVIGGLCNT